jgi:uncharacterized damage-inducible protein DinB
MDVADVRFLFAYDRWATEQVLEALDGIDPEAWGTEGVVGDRGLGSILVHTLGAHMRWRLAFDGSEDRPAPEESPLQSPAEVRAMWATELDAFDALVDEITPGFMAFVHDGVPVQRMLLHLINHGTQHRSEAALLLTQAGRSPGELDMIDFAEAIAAGRVPEPSTRA